MLERLLATVHLLSGAAWFGALVYRVFFVDPKAARFLNRGPEFERFSLDLAHGMRLVVLAALLACGLSGFVWLGLKWNSGETWLTLMGVKAGLWAVALALFAYISWVFWPRRVFATADEWPRVRRQGVWLALTMIGIAAAGMVLGQVARAA
ncbi:MAG TPA: hypothetical protein VM597_20745 [Gemmataceae bacterium]|jgi:hypothetical protein|nr:hypothetical protein [Gemmataceae bacterium]